MLDMIVNPAASSGRTYLEFHKKIFPLFKGTDCRIHYSTSERSVGEIAGRLTVPGRADFVNLVVVGGDGTMNEVLNGIRDFDHTRIGLIPCGSGNDLARDLGLPDDRKELASRIIKERTVRITDLGETILQDTGQRRLFCVSSGAGFDAQCCEMAGNAPMKQILNSLRLGKLIYLYEAIKLIFTWKSPHAALCLAGAQGEGKEPGEEHFRRFVFAAAMNHRFEGGGFMMSPAAKDDDGLLDVCIVHDLKIPDFFRFFPSTTKGKHVRQTRVVSQRRSSSIRIRSKVPLWVHTDGEAFGQSVDIQMWISEKKLNLMN